MKDKTPKTFCALAWVHSFVNIGGEYQVCCTADEFSPGIDNGDGKVMNIKDQPSLDAVMNSSYMKEMRKGMMTGQWHQACTRCFESEKLGGTSRRQIENSRYEELIPDLVAQTREDYSIPTKIKFADYRLGNLCNLQCRMCNPRSSIMWIKEWNEMKSPNSGELMSSEAEAEYRGYDWIDSDFLLNEFKSKVHELDTLHFAGGEPLITKQMARMLEICVEEGVASKILLTYNTNLTKLPERVLELWKSFREVRLLVSVDGYGPVNDYIRMPIKWSVIEKNLRFLDSRTEEFKISEILLSTTVQAYNILNLPALYEHLKTYQNVVPALNLINLYGPIYLRTQVLPESLKTHAARQLMEIKASLLETLPESKQYHAHNIDQVIAFMNEENLEHFLPEFWRFSSAIDQKKGMRLIDYNPLLHKLLMFAKIDQMTP